MVWKTKTMESANNGKDLDSPFDDAAMDVDEGGPRSTSGKGGGKAGKWEPGSSSSFLNAGALSSSSDDDEDGGGVLGGVSPDAVSRFCKDAARSFFDERGLISHQINSYDYFVDVGLQRVFDSFGEIEVLPEYDPSAKAEGGWRHATVRFGKVKVERPSIWWEKVDVAMGDGMGGKGGKRPGKGPKGEDPGGGDSLAGGYLKLLPKHARLMKMSYSGRIKVETSWEVGVVLILAFLLLLFLLSMTMVL